MDGAFCANTSPVSLSREIWRVCASAVVGPPLNWAIVRFKVKGIGWRDCAAFSNAGLITIRNGARGQTGRAREELKTVRRGAATRERFLEGGGQKRFGVSVGCHAVLVPPMRRLPLVPGFGDPCSLGDWTRVRAKEDSLTKRTCAPPRRLTPDWVVA
jgi:hypothetical protein